MLFHLYPDLSVPIDYFAVMEFFSPLSFRLHPPFQQVLSEEEKEQLALHLARIRVLSADEEKLNENVVMAEKEYERRNVRREILKVGPVYSGFHFVSLLAQLASFRPRSSEMCIIFTNQRLATYEPPRWHLRTVIFSYPVVLSTTGFREAPARPREYYVLKQADPLLSEAYLSSRLDWLQEDDARYTDVAIGYMYQAIFFAVNPVSFSFCEEPSCALFNSHWQAEMLEAQGKKRLCSAHQEEWGRICQKEGARANG